MLSICILYFTSLFPDSKAFFHREQYSNVNNAKFFRDFLGRLLWSLIVKFAHVKPAHAPLDPSIFLCFRMVLFSFVWEFLFLPDSRLIVGRVHLQNMQLCFVNTFRTSLHLQLCMSSKNRKRASFKSKSESWNACNELKSNIHKD
jgi:hypothetical protein